MQRKHTETRTAAVASDRAMTPEENTAYPDTVHAAPRWYGRSYDAFTWLALLGGLWIAILPWVMNFATVSPRLQVNDLIIGLAAAFIAMGSMTALRGVTGSGLANVVLGAWLILTAFWPFPRPAGLGFMIGQIVGGAVVLAFALAGQLGSQKDTR
ncbi:MAG TPA: SPW repeat protein [Streptosporangiales bacterium]